MCVLYVQLQPRRLIIFEFLSQGGTGWLSIIRVLNNPPPVRPGRKRSTLPRDVKISVHSWRLFLNYWSLNWFRKSNSCRVLVSTGRNECNDVPVIPQNNIVNSITTSAAKKPRNFRRKTRPPHPSWDESLSHYLFNLVLFDARISWCVPTLLHLGSTLRRSMYVQHMYMYNT